MYRLASYPHNSHRAAGRPERLLRASVTAFCATQRPTRREIAQLDDLATPLLGRVSDEALRFVAAALSETPHAPAALVRRLADLPADISAPLLVRSPVLTNIDLVALIGRHGLSHARAIAARTDLDARIRRLAQVVGAMEDAPASTGKESGAAEEARERLRDMMRPAGTPPLESALPPGTTVKLRWDGEPTPYRKLRSTALAGAPALFHTALADALGIGVRRARAITDSSDVSAFIVALRALALSDEEAFLLMQCIRHDRGHDIRAVSAFLDAYAAVNAETAARFVEAWREPSDDTVHAEPANRPSPQKLRAS
ncbi:MAG: hypothetical protein KL840_16745 [Aquamicrobium sp.]|nr:hypothetical protein [Aquamicrobium sp.]